MDEAAKKLHIRKPSDWGKVTTFQMYDVGGCSLLTSYYNSSLYACLQSVYRGL